MEFWTFFEKKFFILKLKNIKILDDLVLVGENTAIAEIQNKKKIKIFSLNCQFKEADIIIIVQ